MTGIFSLEMNKNSKENEGIQIKNWNIELLNACVRWKIGTHCRYITLGNYEFILAFKVKI